MKLLCDENVRHSIVRLLDQEGYEVARVQDVLALGTEDSRIVSECRSNGWILLTNDDDFFEFEAHPGILFLSEQRTPPRKVVTAIQRIERYVGASELEGRVLHVPDGWV